MFDHKDGGYKSRKMAMAYVAMAVLSGGFLLVGQYPAMQVSFGEFTAGILGVLSIYIGGNTAIKWMTPKGAESKTPKQTPPGGPKVSDED